MTSRITTIIAGTALAAAALGATGVAVAGGGSGRSVGPDYVYGPSNPFADARAVVHVVRTGQGKSHITLGVSGVEAAAGRTFGAHVHQQRCGQIGTDAGGHYQHAGAFGTLEEREVWLDVTINSDGNGTTHSTRPWRVDQSRPRSVIIHALPTASKTGAAGDRLACIDLDGN